MERKLFFYTSMEKASNHALVVGVLELQGDFAEHIAMLRQCGTGTVKGIRQLDDLGGIHALVIPGGESTVISKLLVELNMMDRIKQMVADGMPVFGTCAGCILLARDIRQRPDQPRIGALNVTVDRNAYGSQIHSSEVFVNSQSYTFPKGSPLRVVLIRAPAIVEHADEVEVLASYEGTPILVRQGSILACTFHPELTNDVRVHALFLDIVSAYKKKYGKNSDL